MRRRPRLSSENLYLNTIKKITEDNKISRHDVACFTNVDNVMKNHIQPFMNGGPLGENWNTGPGGFYDSIKESKKSLIGIELGFKADEYGQKVSELLIQQKKDHPKMYVGLLIDGFVSLAMSTTPPQRCLDSAHQSQQ